MKLAPGSASWLLRHELRLAWRGTGSRRLWFLTGISALLWLVYHVAAWGLLEDFDTMPPGLFVAVGVGVWFVFTLILAKAINLSVGAFFDRGDLDLLLASPLPPRSVLFVRGLGVAIVSVALYAWLITPFANVGLLAGQPRLLSIYPALVAMGLLAGAIGMASTVALVRLLGARRARTVAQLLGAFVGASIFLVTQFDNIVAPEQSQRWRAALARLAADGGALDRDSVVWLPLNAMLGQPIPLLALAGAGAGAFAWVITRLARRFAAGAQESMTPARPVAAAPAQVRFRAGLWRNVLVKEWKLIAREPQLIAHTLLQSLYLLPLAFVWLRGESAQAALVPAMILLAATLASGLVWLAVAAEDAPELLASAPVERRLLRRAKLVAGLAPVELLMLPLAIVLAFADVAAAAIFTACVLGATMSAGAIHLLLPRTGRRRDLRRRGKNDLLASVLQFITSISWAGLAWCLLSEPFYAPLPALAALGAPLAAWSLGRRRRSDFDSA